MVDFSNYLVVVVVVEKLADPDIQASGPGGSVGPGAGAQGGSGGIGVGSGSGSSVGGNGQGGSDGSSGSGKQVPESFEIQIIDNLIVIY